MRNFILVLTLLFTAVPSVALAQSNPGDDFVTFDPSVNVGLGIEMPTGMNQSTYGMVVVKGYLLTMGFPKEIGMQVLGLGVAHSAGGNTSLVLSPMMYFIGRVGVGPEFLVQSTEKTNFGITLSYRF